MGTTTTQERTNMVNAREAAYLTQQQVADLMKVDVKSVNGWEKARTTPYLRQREPLRKAIKFTGTDEELLQVFLVEKPQESTITDSETINICQEDNQSRQMTAPCQTTPNRAILESTDSIVIHIPGSAKGIREFMEFARRQFMEVLAQIGLAASFGGMSLGLVSFPSVDPEDYLDICSESIGTWWSWLNQGNYSKLERVLLKHAPVLKRLAYTDSPFQCVAARLAAQAKIMQMLLVTRKHNFVEREIVCADAVRLGQISGNRGIIATALDWQGNTYTLCYRQPQTAIPILNNGLSVLKSESPLIESAICSNLSIAYAQEGDEIEAMKYTGMAISAMPDYPELDPFYPCIQFRQSELDQLVGKAYLYLAEHYPDSNYAQLAYDIFEQAMSKQAVNQEYVLSGTLIKKADAARALGKMDGFVEDLTKGFRIGVEIDNLRRLIEANNVISNLLPKWKQETSVQNLQKEITHAINVCLNR